ncbi:MAG: phage regulatory CII family protein [Acidovorax temperans]|uniref:phage regulatory CII family protein n=1 Tax=Acidovorax temperans TaxID=80878 RepID=UPI00391B4103
MDVLDSVRRAVRHYPGGLEAVALRLGKSPSTLEKELRAAPQYKLGAMDAAEIAAMCTQLGTPHALDYPTRLAEHCSATLLPLPQGLQPDSITAGAVAGLMRELADVVGAVAAADADGEISANELKSIQLQWAELVGSGQQLMLALEAKHEATMAKWVTRQGGAA